MKNTNPLQSQSPYFLLVPIIFIAMWTLTVLIIAVLRLVELDGDQIEVRDIVGSIFMISMSGGLCYLFYHLLSNLWQIDVRAGMLEVSGIKGKVSFPVDDVTDIRLVIKGYYCLTTIRAEKYYYVTTGYTSFKYDWAYPDRNVQSKKLIEELKNVAAEQKGTSDLA